MTLVKKLIEEHNQAAQYAEESPEKDGFLSGMKKAIDIVQNHNGWISVDDELPQLFESVLTLSSKNTYQILALQEHYFLIWREMSVLISVISHIGNPCQIHQRSDEMRVDFKFCSIFSRRIRKIFIRHNMTMKDVADALGWQVSKVSAYYNDRLLLSDDDALALSNLLTQIGHKFTDVELQEMQKQAVFVDLTKNDFLDEIREKFNQEKQTIRMATLTIPHDNS